MYVCVCMYACMYIYVYRCIFKLRFSFQVFDLICTSFAILDLFSQHMYFIKVEGCKMYIAMLRKYDFISFHFIKAQQKPTSICLIIYKLSTCTKLRHSAHYCVGLRRRNSRNKEWNSSARQNRLTIVTNSREIAHKSWMARCSPRSRILAEAINTMHLISIEQQNEEGNTLHTDPSNNQGSFNR